MYFKVISHRCWEGKYDIRGIFAPMILRVVSNWGEVVFSDDVASTKKYSDVSNRKVSQRWYVRVG